MNPTKKVTHADVRRITAGMTKEDRNAKTCELVGHSRIINYTGPEPLCARCGDAADPQTPDMVFVGETTTMASRRRLKALNWRDRVYAPDSPLSTGSF